MRVGRQRYARHEIELRKAEASGLKIERASADTDFLCTHQIPAQIAK